MRTVLIIASLVPVIALGQEYPRQEIDISRITEELYGGQDNDLNYEELYENLVQLISHPLNLNVASAAELELLQILSAAQLKSLISYRDDSHGFTSIYELQAVPGLDLSTIYKLAPFVKVPDPAASIDKSLFKRIKNESDNYFIMRMERALEKSTGYSEATPVESKFKGSPDKLSLRFKSTRPGDFSMGFNLEKDAGEALVWSFKNRTYGFDHLSWHIQLQNKGRLRNLVAGDFQIQQGQGLTFGGMLGTGKGSETITSVRRSNVGIMPYTSMYEGGFLRGTGITFDITKKIQLTSFISSIRRDGTVESDSADIFISSLQTTGLHRNQKELEKRKQIRETQYGAVLQYKIANVEMGMLYGHMNVSEPLVPKRTVYNQFAFRGKALDNIDVFVNGHIGNTAIFGEAAYTWNHGTALVAGLLHNLTPEFDIALLYRRYDRSFHTLNGSAFSEGSTPQNESGWYWGVKYRISKKYGLAGYLDIFKFPWLRYRVYAPSTGHEWLIRFNYQPTRKVSLYFQAREENKARNSSGGPVNLFFIQPVKKNNYWIQCEYELTEGLKLRSRIQFSKVDFHVNSTQGMALVQDINVEVGRLQVTGRYGLFDTDDYENRQYVYENDVLQAYSMPAYYGKGVRKMLMVRFKINRYVSLWVRYAHIRYEGDEKIGSGYDTIEGSIRNDLKFQVRILF